MARRFEGYAGLVICGRASSDRSAHALEEVKIFDRPSGHARIISSGGLRPRTLDNRDRVG